MNAKAARGAAISQPLAIHIDISVEAGPWGEAIALETLAKRATDAVVAALGLQSTAPTELGIVFTDDASIRALNGRWRGKDKATNVLSFPAFSGASPENIPPMLGDIVIAQETVAREAALEGKPFDHHVSHLVVHGLLHLLGLDHETGREAEAMEEAERRILATLAIPDPYAVTDEDN